jgi:aryl-alcohol dehydrogenase-like predicted oxidoreductase
MVDYNVLRPEREPLIAARRGGGKGVLAGMPLAMGHTRPLLAGCRGPQDLWYAARALARIATSWPRARVPLPAQLPDMTGAQAALGLCAGQPGVSAAVFGATRPAHLRENLAASGLRCRGRSGRSARRRRQAVT